MQCASKPSRIFGSFSRWRRALANSLGQRYAKSRFTFP
jgi:hypothetical protein